MRYSLIASIFAGILILGCEEKPPDPNHVHFMHQSTGGNLIEDHDGVTEHPDPDYGLRTLLENAGHTFTDNWMDDSYPTSIAEYFSSGGRGLTREAKSAGILLFKSCYYPIDGLTSDEALDGWKQAYIDEIIPYAKEHPDQILVAMPAVPYRKEDCPEANHDRARAWADWLKGEFIDSCLSHGAENVTSFDLFDIWAYPDSNWLRTEYRGEDSHPNAYASLVMADSIAAFIAELIE